MSRDASSWMLHHNKTTIAANSPVDLYEVRLTEEVSPSMDNRLNGKKHNGMHIVSHKSYTGQ
jgi:hypothetical protein